MTAFQHRWAPFGGAGRGAEPVDERSQPGLDPRMHDALSDLHAYVLAMDAERQRLGDRVTELAKRVSQEGVELARRRAEITGELDALRATLLALRACADPVGDQL
jgi:hypothetical protein